MDFPLMQYFFRLLGLSGFLRYDFEESGMKYNILSAQMWLSWVFGFSGFQSGSPIPKGESCLGKLICVGTALENVYLQKLRLLVEWRPS